MTCGVSSSNETATRSPRPGAKFKVGEVIVATSTAPVLNRYIWYSKHGESFPGVALGASTGCVARIPESVRP